MREKLLRNNCCYLGNHKVFCFSDIEIPKYLNNLNNTKYDIGDFIPTSGYSYIYSPTLIIVDYVNKLIHTIVNSIYCETFKIHNEELRIATNSYLYRLMFGNVNFKIIDIYGNFLNIKNIEDLLIAIVTYPQIELSLINNKYLNQTDNDNFYSNILLETIDYTNSESISYINGYYKSNNDNDMLIIASNIKDTLLNKSTELYMQTWLSEKTLLDTVNELLKNIRLYFLLSKNKIGFPCIYYANSKKLFTHIDKVKKQIENFVLYNDCDIIESVLETIFLYAEYEDEYEDFIISTISEYASLNIV